MKSGIYQLSESAYHADEVGAEPPTLSASIAAILLNESPRHAWAAHPKLGGGVREDSEKFDLGTAAHAHILEGREDSFAIIDAEDWRTKAAKALRGQARLDGKTPLLKRHVEAVRTMSNAVRAQLAEFEDAPAPLTNGKPEQTLVWQEGAVWCKARVDWLHDDYRTIDDLKTGAVSANPDAWTRTIYGRGGDLQVAFYLRGLKATTGSDADFRFIVAENHFPFCTSVVALGPEALAHAADKVEQAIQLWDRCVAMDNWPGYPVRTCYIDPPAWSLSKWMESEDKAASSLAPTNWERS